MSYLGEWRVFLVKAMWWGCKQALQTDHQVTEHGEDLGNGFAPLNISAHMVRLAGTVPGREADHSPPGKGTYTLCTPYMFCDFDIMNNIYIRPAEDLCHCCFDLPALGSGKV
jgi:hypothetical protein